MHLELESRKYDGHKAIQALLADAVQKARNN